MPTCSLPSDPSLEHLRNQAKRLQRLVRDRAADALALVREFHPRFASATADSPELDAFTRADAQLVVARRYGFPSWNRLRQHLGVVERYSRSPHRQAVGGPVEDDAALVDEFLRLACLVYSNDDPARWRRAAELLAERPALGGASLHAAAAAGDVAAARAPDRGRPRGRRAARAGRTAGSRCCTPPTPGCRRRGRGSRRWRWRGSCSTHGADPNAGYLWEGLPSPFTALTGAFGRGEGDPPPHEHEAALATLLLEAGADPNDAQTIYNCSLVPRATRTWSCCCATASGAATAARGTPAWPGPPDTAGARAGRADLGRPLRQPGARAAAGGERCRRRRRVRHPPPDHGAAQPARAGPEHRQRRRSPTCCWRRAPPRRCSTRWSASRRRRCGGDRAAVDALVAAEPGVIDAARAAEPGPDRPRRRARAAAGGAAAGGARLRREPPAAQDGAARGRVAGRPRRRRGAAGARRRPHRSRIATTTRRRAGWAEHNGKTEVAERLRRATHALLARRPLRRRRSVLAVRRALDHDASELRHAAARRPVVAGATARARGTAIPRGGRRPRRSAPRTPGRPVRGRRSCGWSTPARSRPRGRRPASGSSRWRRSCSRRTASAGRGSAPSPPCRSR